jgi:hypothetical protein
VIFSWERTDFLFFPWQSILLCSMFKNRTGRTRQDAQTGHASEFSSQHSQSGLLFGSSCTSHVGNQRSAAAFVNVRAETRREWIEQCHYRPTCGLSISSKKKETYVLFESIGGNETSSGTWN